MQREPLHVPLATHMRPPESSSGPAPKRCIRGLTHPIPGTGFAFVQLLPRLPASHRDCSARFRARSECEERSQRRAGGGCVYSELKLWWYQR